MSSVDVEMIQESDFGRIQLISGEFLARPVGVRGAECWLAPLGSNQMTDKWILVGEQKLYDFLRPNLEPIGGGEFLFVYDCAATGILWKDGTVRKLVVDHLDLSIDDDLIQLDIPESVRLRNRPCVL